MRVYVTGASGFVGGWMVPELRTAGHEVIPAPGPDELDITDRDGLMRWLSSAGSPDGVVHLAGMAFAPDAAASPAEAFRVNVAGTVCLFESLRALRVRPCVVVSGSSDVYGNPRPADLPLTERAPLAPLLPYAVSKAAQEAVAVEAAVRHGFPVVVTRSFNHAGPGQQPVFVVAAMARRVLALHRETARSIPAGNVDVRRDLSDVRDVARAYRLLLEALAGDRVGQVPAIVNVASGKSVTIRWVIERLCDLAGVEPRIDLDPSLVRPNDPVELRGDASLLGGLTGWSPSIPLERTLADVLADASARLEAESLAAAKGQAGSAR
jgi:GDP-4-dehydro-6-deoxy-D-mannose reductase